MGARDGKIRSVVLIGLALALRLPAQTPPLGQELVVNQETFGDQSSPAVSANGAGGFVVAWADPNYETISARRFDGEGTSLGNAFQVNTNSSSQQLFPALASDATGKFVVAWTVAYGAGDGSAAGIAGRVFDSAGIPLGPEFPINTYTTGAQVMGDVAMSPNGSFVVTWTSQDQGGSGTGVFGQRFDSSASPQGGEFQVHTDTLHVDAYPRVAMNDSGFVIVWQRSNGSQFRLVGRRYAANGDPQGGEFPVNSSGNVYRPEVACDVSGNFVVVWTANSGNTASGDDIFARRFDNSGNPVGNEFRVNSYTTGEQFRSSVAMGPEGDFMVAWSDYGRDPLADIFAQRFDSSGRRIGSEFAVNAFTTNKQIRPSVAQDGRGQFVVAWESLFQDGSGYGVLARRGGFPLPLPMAVDVHPSSDISNVNGILEVGEAAVVEPGYSNTGESPLSLTSSISLGVSGGSIGTIIDGTADYGTIAAGGAANCHGATGDCFELTVSGTRPSPHWDVTLEEGLSSGVAKTWSLHVGESFPDVPRSQLFYAYVENILHNGITGGCGQGSYCPAQSVTRAQMAVFLLKAKHGSSYQPPFCGGVFPDVECPGPFADWIEQLSREGITAGCGGGYYCPDAPVTREQMAVFLLKTKQGSGYTPAPATGIFGDVPQADAFAPWIEELYHRGVTGGCQGSPLLYCPDNPSTRGQMAAFLVKTFGLLIYGP